MEARDERRLLKLQAQLAAVKLLIVDELGYVPLSQTGAELLFEIFSQRHERERATRPGTRLPAGFDWRVCTRRVYLTSLASPRRDHRPKHQGILAASPGSPNSLKPLLLESFAV